ncbi:MAG: outer membrane protein assembly factor BamA [Bacteroidetes bacterium]|nr:MAG: outer membrane protein assembly factor BamA [Bacteroidota bacterium]MBL1143536.1 outer membrane protein assembly factor BamA [Bacteroidota bacterium]MCB0801964.1 outer membrane protein assembly factor BamA [Flavobacteriales bacterium]NOG56338.1 outer membrane protein assembly factor BamA [Bacteroidota bacterium]
MIKKFLAIGLLLLGFLPNIKAQITGSNALDVLDYKNPRSFEIGGITIIGTQNLDHTALKAIAGVEVGQEIKVPGDEISNAIKNLWKQELFTDIKISASKIQGDLIFLNIEVEERPRLSKFRFKGVRKGTQESLRDEIKLIRGKVITPNLIANTKRKITNYFVDKGFYNTEVEIIEEPDSSLKNSTVVTIKIKRNERIKVKDIHIEGNEALSDKKLRRAMKNTKRKKFIRIFKASKFIKSDYLTDKKSIIAKYNSKGYRDAKIVKDTVYQISKKRVVVELELVEGIQYYFGNIKWVGNTKFTTEELDRILGIDKGDRFNQDLFDQRIFQDPNGRDISSLYLDDGYLFFQPNVVETEVRGDTIDFEIRLREGKQARINKVTIVGNTKTNDHVIRREIRTNPGDLFSRADIIRTQRELIQLGYFNQEKLGVNPVPDQASGTVDIEYVVEEQPSDQVELSGGWGGGRIVGSLGLSFNNFSARRMFKKDAWRPLPAGDGQRLSLRAQTNGAYFQSYNISFTEPWLGGRKPNSLSISGYYSVQTNGATKTIQDSDGNSIKNPNRQALGIWGSSVGLGRRLTWPDDFFTLYNELSYQYYNLDNWGNFIFGTGFANNLSFKTILSRNSVDAPIYPRNGSQTSLSLQLTPPYSKFDGRESYDELSNQDRYRFIEFHKWKFNSSWFTSLTSKLVMNTKVGFGYLGSYDNSLGQSPFERFYLGGDGLSGFNLDGSEIIALRGYGDRALSPSIGASVVSKYTMELRYPLSLNPTATIYGLGFVEAGNSWFDFDDFSPFEVRRSAGVGVRIYMPFFGLLGLDWGYRFDDIPGVTDPTKKTEFHFTIGGNIGGW